MSDEKDVGFRSIDAKPNADSIIKPGELVDLVEVTPLTLNDRRIYNVLLENAWEEIDKPNVHAISKSDLRGSHNSNDRVGDSIERLMRAIVKVSVIKDGEPAIERVQMLGSNIELEHSDGMLYYEIPRALRNIISNSTIFARLQKEVMFALSSKYALTLYEMVQKRGNLRFKSEERFTLDEFRGILGVPKGKLSTWSNLQLRAISPAVEEVNLLSDYQITVTPYKKGRRVAGIWLAWMRKEADELSAVGRSFEFSKLGRKERGRGDVQNIVTPDPPVGSKVRARPAWLDRVGEALMSETYETAKLRFPGYDVYAIEAEWRAWAREKEPPLHPDKAYLAFFKTFVEREKEEKY